MDESAIIAFSPALRAAMQKIYDNSKRRCMDSYLDMLLALAKMPEEELVEGALDLERERAGGKQVGGGFGNHWLQALSIKNPISALIVSEMIENGEIPEIENRE